MRIPRLAVVLLLLLVAPAEAATISQTSTPTKRTVVIEGTAGADQVDVALLDDGSVELIASTDLVSGSPACVVQGPGHVVCAAPAAGEEAVDALRFTGGSGDDRLRPTGGFAITFSGGLGEDRLETDPEQQREPVTASGGAGDDVLGGGLRADELDGGAGADRLEARDGNDRVTGGSGEDVLDGGDGRDVLKGGSGSDSLRGIDGAKDTLDCGPGPRDRAERDRADVVKGCERFARKPS